MEIDALFLGAGASTPFDIPTMKDMAIQFEKTLNSGDEKKLYETICNKLQNYSYFDLESLITVLQNITDPAPVVNDILNDPSIHFYFNYGGESWGKTKNNITTLAKANRSIADSLLLKLKEYLIEACTIDPKEEDFKLYNRLFTVILKHKVSNFEEQLEENARQGTQIKIELQIFTTNYDFILETYCMSREIACENGEIGRDVCIRRDNNGRLFDGSGVFKIRKLHGSINWYRNQRGKLRCSERPVKLGEKSLYGDEIVEEVLLYPVRGLYAYREPFYDLFADMKQNLERLNNWLAIGYSFRDKDIAGLFIDASGKNRNLNLCLVGLNSDTVKAVAQDRLDGFKGKLVGSTAKFNHDDIDGLLSFLQNPMNSDVVAKSLRRMTGGG